MQVSHVLVGLLGLLAVIERGECQPLRAKFKKVVVNTANKTFSIEESPVDLSQRILVAVVINRNAYSLPTFLHTLETLKCRNKKKKCDLWYE